MFLKNNTIRTFAKAVSGCSHLLYCRDFVLALSLCAVLSACFKDEPANAECDIEQAYIHTDAPEEMFYNVTDTLINVSSTTDLISFTVRRGVDLTALAPMFVITAGATIEPAGGTTRDFSNGGLTYTVTSEDRQWSRTYTVSFDYAAITANDTVCYDFERYFLDSTGKYYVWSDLSDDGSDLYNWATANPGFYISRSSAAADEYPTVPVTEGYDGACIKLETCSTGSFGEMVNKRLAAGNLFLGTFDVSVALTNTLYSTCFGLVFDRIPLVFSCYYKYTAGAVYQDFYGNTVSGETDTGRIYAVLYRNHDADNNTVVLHGDDVMTNEMIVAIADLGNISDTDEWTYYEAEFDYYEEIDEELLAEQGYNLTIVCSSSDQGAYYEGAIGSTLYVDKMRVICANIE